MDAERQGGGSESASPVQAYALAMMIGLVVGTVGSAFHYCLNMTSGLYPKIASQFSGNKKAPLSSPLS